MGENKREGRQKGVCLLSTFLNFRANPNFRSNRHGRGQGRTYKPGHAGTSSALSSPIPFLNQSHLPSSAKLAAYVSASDERRTQNLGKSIIPENLWVCEGDNSHNTAQSDWTDTGEDTVV